MSLTNINITNTTSFQSSYLYLQSVGSEGIDSTQGNHIRWAFRGTLGEKHLPKRDYATTNHNFNKSNDVVKIYRSQYTPLPFRLDLFSTPAVVDDQNALWIYRFSKDTLLTWFDSYRYKLADIPWLKNQSREIYVYFRNKSKYNEVRANIDPLRQSATFFQNYGEELIEVETKREVFFVSHFHLENHSAGTVTTGPMLSDSLASGAELKTESLSVSENVAVAAKVVSSRKTFDNTLPPEPIRLICENGRSIRFKAKNCVVQYIYFEFYTDYIMAHNKVSDWEDKGEYGLSLDDSTVFNLLEPSAGLVHGTWLRYNENAFVNTLNYQDKWNKDVASEDRNVKQIVQNYITLSDNADNPIGAETIFFDEEETNSQISNLDLLNLASYDYHIARMLGLGFIDNIGTSGNTFIYVAEYTTFGDLEDGLGPREVKHLFMGLPTTEQDHRLPLATEIKDIVPGVFLGNEGEADNLSDTDGYTHNGIYRYVTLYAKEQAEDLIGVPFYQTDKQFSAHNHTDPIYAGIEYRKVPTGQSDSGIWEKPELSKDLAYFNAVPVGETPHYETRPLRVPDSNQALFVHKQLISGTHYYNAYGINWFSRAKTSNVTKSIQTTLQLKNPLKAPSNIRNLLIREESPLLLTSREDQDRYSQITDSDKTLVKLTFDYHSLQELVTHKVPLDSTLSNEDLLNPENANDANILFPDNQEIFAEEVEIFFRNQVPNQVSGQVILVNDHSSNNLLSVVQTQDYILASTGDIISPTIESGTENNYVGGVFMMGEQRHIIHQVTQGTEGPVFTIYKKEISDALVNDTPSIDADNLQAIQVTGDGLFMAIENMQNINTWGTPNPLALKVNIGNEWGIHREIIESIDEQGNIEKSVEKSRGIWSENTSIIEKIADSGTYTITLNDVQLEQHPQYNREAMSVEWFRGIVRIFTQGSIDVGGVARKTRKTLQVIKVENIGTSDALVLYVQDPSFSTEADYDAIPVGTGISVNFYPGYKAYLYANNTYKLTESKILPNTGEGVKYSIFGLRSRDIDSGGYYSKISMPSLMFAQEIVEPLPPEQPTGALYATRPDFFGRSTYTIHTEYQHQPHAVLTYRSNDEVLLNALYEKSTVLSIREALKTLGGNDEEYFANRWRNFLNFEELGIDGDYQIYPPVGISEDGYKFPNPDKQTLFDWANSILQSLGQSTITETPGSLAVGDARLLPFVKGAIYNAFVPLTETPVIYQYIPSDTGYEVVNKKQVLKDKNGYVLAPTHPDFEMAPMMKVIGTHKTQFTDFRLDGTSQNIYFYGVKELGTQMKIGEFSPFLGPVKLVNTNPPEKPEIKRLMPVLGNEVFGITPAIQIEMNAYPKVQNIRKVNIYRAYNKLDAQSVRTMNLVKTIDLEEAGILEDNIWKVEDNFEDLPEVPYSDGLFYRITVSRQVEYVDKNGTVITEYVPSQASKIVASMMAENSNPATPTLKFYSEPLGADGQLHEITFHWNKTCYKGKYHLYKMNAKGNWEKIYELQSNELEYFVLMTATNLATGSLTVRDAEDKPIYHHFKVVAENTSGMFSTEEKIVTVYRPDQWNDLGGISSDGTDGMILHGTFLVRPN